MFVRIDPKKRLDLCDCIKVFIQAGNYAKALNTWARSAFGNAFYICAINHIYYTQYLLFFILPQPKYYWQREPRPAASNLHYSNSTQANLQHSLGDDDNDENYTQQHHHHSDQYRHQQQ